MVRVIQHYPVAMRMAMKLTSRVILKLRSKP